MDEVDTNYQDEEENTALLQILKQKDLDIIADILNNALKQVLRFKDPYELFYADLSRSTFLARCAKT